ncbi:MAG TPA: Bax inhibitor-1/YccA family protein [Oceanospirillales bacterium]|nr:Bax inhibitor-1/YccA family protein [Oceanospirillales bacterium]
MKMSFNLKSSNPAMKAFEQSENMSFGPTDQFVVDESQRMTVNGTINKTGLLVLLAIVTGAWGWTKVMTSPQLLMPFFWTSLVVSIGCYIALWKRPEWASTVAPIYAAVEGVFLGALSGLLEGIYPGIAVQAALGTMATVIGMLIAFRTGIIRATPLFRKVIVTATMGIMIFYLISIAASFFGVHFSVNSFGNSSMFSIGFSLFIVVIAALNLILDFDFIERGAAEGAPKHMEWYGAFGLMVTIVWLYIEILRLIAKLRSD